MESNGITEENVLHALRRVPSERWPEVLQYLSSLEHFEGTRSMPPVRNALDLAHSELVGIWTNRTDIGGSQDYAHHLRQQAENRQK
jgi:hypothetical protein